MRLGELKDPQSRQAVPHMERLLGSGTRLFYRHGYHGTSVDALLADAGVPRRTRC
ncbi:TetR family transcriptional regulator [Hoyosella subflava]|uniref:TetR family transcriptional regulator n=1 Tax=Hoyosella subflava TaxID=639313 RepID=UPI0009FEDCBC